MSDDPGLLEKGQVIIIGGGPAGVSCGVRLLNLARQMGRNIQVTLYEVKHFGGKAPHYNQCVGVISPPIQEMLESHLGIPFPWHLVQRKVAGYVLHSDERQILLGGDGDPTYVVRRVQFDDYLLDQARQRGIEVVASRVTDIEIHPSHAIVYSESDSRQGDVVIGAFGLDEGTGRMFARATPYRQPRFLSSIVTKIHPSPEFIQRFGEHIHAFLPSIREIEFGAITPKGNHLTINIAGEHISAISMDRFLTLPAVKALLPQRPQDHVPAEAGLGKDDYRYFKGRFPISLSAHFYGHRYLIVGDAAGLVRPFKGKGVIAACIGGAIAAEAIMREGISGKAFQAFFKRDPYYREIRSDIWYGRALRWLASFTANHRLLDTIIDLAQKEDSVRTALFNCVSAQKPFREIVRETMNLRLGTKALKALALSLAGIPRSL